MILLNYFVFDMFLTTKCSSSGGFVHAVLWYFVMHPYKHSGRRLDMDQTVYTDALQNTIKLQRTISLFHRVFQFIIYIMVQLMHLFVIKH
jgi:hypothetical protein